MGSSSEPAVHFLNIEYFFRLLYEAVSNPGGVSVQGDLMVLASQIWMSVTAIAFLVSILLLIIFINAVIRYQQARHVMEASHETLQAAHAEEVRDHSRWSHVQALVSSPHENDWRQAIIEADIMLDDLLSQLGYPGNTLGEKLKAVDPSRFHTLQNAWEAHKVRNEIAHSGSGYQLEEHHAHRTIALYESVMREHGEI